MTVSTEDVRALLDCQEADAVLVLIEGRAEVVTPTELDSPTTAARCRSRPASN